jgi:hypothetical protein
VEQDEKERLERGAEAELNKRCGDGTVQKVEVLQYGDDPVIEPGQAMLRVILTQPGERKHPVISMSVGPLDRTAPGRNLTPVMARLHPTDVEVLDALITAGIVPNRAEGVRWALARIRERPAYTQLREHIGKIDELKAQL